VWKGVADLMRGSGARRWIGYGPETLREVFPPHYPAELGVLERTDAMPDRAHNETLDLLVSAGAAGVVLELGFFAAVLVCAVRVSDPVTAAALLAAAAAHVVEIQLGIATVVSRLLFLAVAALIAGGDQPETAAVPVASRAVSRQQRRKAHRVTGPAADRTAVWLLAAAILGAVSPVLTPSAPVFFGVMVAFAVLFARAIAAPFTIGGPLLIAGTVLAAVAALPLAITPSRADGFSKAAATFESQRRWPEAVAAYRDATRLQPREAYYFAGLGRSLLQDAAQYEPAARGARLQASRAAFERARALMPWDPDNTRHLASLARMEAASRPDGREAPLAEADALYADATRRMPGLTGLWVDWGWVDVDRRRLPQALQKVNHALALNPERVDALALRGYIESAQSSAAGDRSPR
jgi:hypothetical protein